MQLLKMELRGFKSFADKTTLDFDKGITAIVGPNGSGKSNISDAVRWVMGEQNIRQLRGQKAEDIIFAGTASRKPQGAAEVSLYFDNSDHQLDTEFAEVVVTRRIFRSGESEFFINKRPCRLKDIHMLLADTGIGQDSMAVIGQNRIDLILNSKPEERRIFFEEAAGISRYKSRKQEGLRKIAETERNLERIRDMMSVLEEQLEPMQEQAQRLAEFRRLDQKRISYEGTLTLQELRNAERLLSKAENSRLIAQQQQRDAETALAELSRKRQRMQQHIEQRNQQVRQLDEETLAAQHDLDSLKSRYESFQVRQQEITGNLKQLSDEENSAKEKHQAAVDACMESQRLWRQKKQELAASEQGLYLMQDLFHQAEQKADKMAAELNKVQTQQLERRQRLFVLQRDIEDLHRQLEETRKQLEEGKEQQKTRLSALKKATSKRQQLQKNLKDADAQTTAGAQAVQIYADRKKHLQASLQQLETEYRKLQGKHAALQQRIGVLQSLAREHEGISRPAKIILSADTGWRKKICGLAGELCRIPAQYAAAIDIALGAAAQYIVTEDEQTARTAISYLKERRGGRTTFLPLNTIQERHCSREELSAVQETGILGFANELIEYDQRFHMVFANLLGKTLLAESAEAAARAERNHQHRLRIVCLDGTLFNTGGSLTGGSLKNREGSLIGRQVALQELQKQEKQINQDLQLLSQKNSSIRKQAEQSAAEMAVRQQQWQQADLERQKLMVQLQAVEKEESQFQSDTNKSLEWLQRLSDRRDRIQNTLAEKEEQQQPLMDETEMHTDELDAAHQQAVAEMETYRQTLTKRQVEIAKLQEQVQHMQQLEKQQKEFSIQQAAEQERLQQRHQQLSRRLEETINLIASIKTNITEKEAQTTAKAKKKEELYKSREAQMDESRQLEIQAEELRQEQMHWNQSIHTAEVQEEKYHGEISHSEEQLARQGLTRQLAMERRQEGTLKELNETVKKLRSQIAALGQINPNADAEYKNTADKLSFYHTQCEDLQESRKRLQTVVAEIDTAMSGQFSKAFAEIGRHFQRIFSQLFGGGKAQLFLTDTHDILNAGVSILIQPPGKKQQALTLLSGGERALTVIALLLSFLAYHPAPFVLFDEADAALDEANVARMARYMKKYSNTTQFIVITHRRKTMEAADTLLGVTMEEKGVSRLLTVKVEDMIEKGR